MFTRCNCKSRKSKCLEFNFKRRNKNFMKGYCYDVPLPELHENQWPFDS